MAQNCTMGWIYLVRAKKGNGPIKIGWSSRPTERLRLMHWGSPVELEFIDLRWGPRIFEAEIHRKLRKHKLRGEWYSLAPKELEDLLVFIHERCPLGWTEETERDLKAANVG